MSDESQELPVSVLDREHPAVRFPPKFVGAVTKALFPAVVTGERVDYKKYPRYAKLQAVAAGAELLAIQQTAVGNELGPAAYLAGRFTSLLVETLARRKEHKRGERTRRLEDERFITRATGTAVAIAAKVAIPTFFSTTSTESKAGKQIRGAGMGLEVLAGGALAAGHAEAAGILYGLGRLPSLSAELTEDYPPFKTAKELVKKTGRAVGGTTRKIGSEIGRRAPSGDRIKDFCRKIGEKVQRRRS